MAMTVADLKAYVSPSQPLRPSDDAYAATCWEQAQALITQYVGSATVPTAIVDRATLEVAAELFHRRQAPSGITQFATPEGSAGIRVARDPMIAAYDLLSPFLPRFIA